MLENINEFVQNPVVLLIGFILTIFGSIEMIVSFAIWLKNRKENKQFSVKNKNAIEYLNRKNDIEISKEVLKDLHNQIDNATSELKEIPIRIEKEILKRQIEIEEQNLTYSQHRLSVLKDKMRNINNPIQNKTEEIFSLLQKILNSVHIKNLFILLVSFASILFFLRLFVPEYITKIISIIFIYLFFLYINKVYSFMRNSYIKIMISYSSSVILSLLYLDMIHGATSGILTYIICFLLYAVFIRHILNIKMFLINFILNIMSFLVLCFVIFTQIFEVGLFFDYTLLIFAVYVLQIILIFLNMYTAYSEYKLLDEKAKK